MMARALALLCALAAGLSCPAAAEPSGALAGLVVVGVDVDLAASQESLSAEQLTHRIRARLREGAPALTLDAAARDRLRLGVAVQPHGASTLRGFWLPFSGTYGIGLVRLSLERVVTIAGVHAPVRASVWHAERQAAGPWRESPAAILALLDANLTDFLDAYHRR
jgi:hypothetical protein